MKKLSQKQWIAVAVSLVVIAIFFLSGTFIFSFLTSNTTPNTTSMNDNEQPVNTADTSAASAASTLGVTDLVVGTGTEAVAGKIITVHYTGKLTNGQVFDSSVSRGQPFQFELGAGSVIPGWEQGFEGMKVGGKRLLVIPPALGYGAQGAGGVIPPNATLIFDVELLNVQ